MIDGLYLLQPRKVVKDTTTCRQAGFKPVHALECAKGFVNNSLISNNYNKSYVVHCYESNVKINSHRLNKINPLIFRSMLEDIIDSMANRNI